MPPRRPARSKALHPADFTPAVPFPCASRSDASRRGAPRLGAQHAGTTCAAAIGWRLPRILRERRAATAVEFALVLGPLLALLLGSLQVSLIFFANEELQSAATNVGRMIMTGQVQQASMTQAQFQQAVCNQLIDLFPCNGLMVDVQAATNYSSISTGSPTLTYNQNGTVNNAWNYNPGGPDDVVIVRVMYMWPVFGGALIPGLSDQPGSTRLLVGTSVFKNEPYP